MPNDSRGENGYSDYSAPKLPPLPPLPPLPSVPELPTVRGDDDAPAYEAPKPGTPEFRAMVERHKDIVEAETGIRPDVILDIGEG